MSIGSANALLCLHGLSSLSYVLSYVLPHVLPSRSKFKFLNLLVFFESSSLRVSD